MANRMRPKNRLVQSSLRDFGTSQYGLQLKSYTFAAENQVDMEKWVKSLSCASYDYLKMVVSELQHRLDELNALKLRDSMITSEIKKETSPESVTSSRRINPFDCVEQEPVQTVTFLDLHEQYGRVMRKYFRSIEEVQAKKNAESSSS
ncbi:hypothetical protein TYRP_007244 [Tyrophagus putrescentiae]|nr:hypothetical protein TYRP_007244 [Tyrophagus putrescentiae]